MTVSNSKVLDFLMQYLKSYKYKICVVLVALMLVSGSLLLIGKTTKQLVDEALINGDLKAMNVVMVKFMIIVLVFGVASFFRSFFINSISEDVIIDIRNDIFAHLLRLQIKSFDVLLVNEIQNILSVEIAYIGRIITDVFSFCIRNSIMLIGGLILMFFQSIKLSILVITLLLLLLFPIIRLARTLRSYSKSSQKNLSDLYNDMSEMLYNIKLIYAFNQQNSQIESFKEVQKNYKHSSNQRIKLKAMFFSTAITAVLSIIVFIIWIGNYNVITGTLSSGELLSFLYYSMIVASSLGGIAEVVSEFPRYFASMERVRFLSSILTTEHGIEIPITSDLDGRLIKFQKVCFSYPSRPNTPVLEELSLSIENKFTAIVGKSGSGKSTIVQLLVRFFETDKGDITVGEVSLKEINIYQVRGYFSYVFQDSPLFSTTIRKNILFSKPNATEEELASVVKASMVDEFLERLPEGLESFVGEKGVLLSGGQKQRIAIARGLLSDAKLLLFDEATSALDRRSEQQILTNIRQIFPNKSLIVITHRISAIEKADNIIVLDKGKILDSGKHEELIERCKLYQQMSFEEQTMKGETLIS